MLTPLWNQCRWIDGDPLRGGCWCTHNRLTASSYCESHHKKAYIPYPPPQKRPPEKRKGTGMNRMVFQLALAPQTKERPRAGRAGKDGRSVFYTPLKTKKFEANVASLVTVQMNRAGYLPFPTGTPLHAHVRFTFGVKDSKQWHRFKTSRIDLDNSLKAIFDALNGVVYPDDSQIVFITALKGYGPHDRIDIEFLPLGLDGFSVAFGVK